MPVDVREGAEAVDLRFEEEVVGIERISDAQEAHRRDTRHEVSVADRTSVRAAHSLVVDALSRRSRLSSTWPAKWPMVDLAGRQYPFGVAPLMHPRRGIGLSPPDPVVCKLLTIKE
jgi:hypothetical protein